LKKVSSTEPAQPVTAMKKLILLPLAYLASRITGQEEGITEPRWVTFKKVLSMHL
jgi:hypothetical protein